MSDAGSTFDAAVQDKVARLSRWIAEGTADDVEITWDTDLIDGRIVTSLQFTEMVLLIEELRGAEIDDGERDLDSFRTLRSIAERYFAS